jgi:prepilin-type N-terminal cleavage/methylation domain-containing protein
MRPATRPGISTSAGFSLVELLVAMGIFTVVMAATLGGLSSVMQGNDVVMNIAAMNDSARAGMDLMVRDLLQVGSGLPASHSVSIPSGEDPGDAERIRIPGPPGTAFMTAAADLALAAVIPRNGAGPTIDGVATDVLSILMADNTFLDVALTAVAADRVTVAAGPDLGAGADRVEAGQLMMISKGSFTTLVQVTSVDVDARILLFEVDDSLNLNQPDAPNGSLSALNAEAPVNDAAATRISRLRMISYYLDNTTEPAHPRLVRRINNGHPGNFDNDTLGTAVAIDVIDLQFTYDISNGEGNPGGVEMNDNDKEGDGSCAPAACGATQIRKVNVMLRSRPPSGNQVTTRSLTNLLQTQVSLRAMAFVDRYQ